MTDDEINQVICKVLGRGYHKPTEEELKNGSYYQYEPRFTEDLNSIFEAMQYAGAHIMNADQWEEFGKQLHDAHPTACVANSDGSIDYYDVASLATGLTARQYSECFVKAMDLWKDAS